MSEQTGATTTTEETNNEQGKGEKEFAAITSQDELNKIVGARLAREREKFADYDELKAAADKLKQFEESQKTESQKQADRIAELEQEATALKAEALRAQVAQEKSDPEKGILIDPSLLNGSTREALEASADALIKFKGESSPFPKADPSQGARGSTAKLSAADRFAEAFKDRI